MALLQIIREGGRGRGFGQGTYSWGNLRLSIWYRNFLPNFFCVIGVLPAPCASGGGIVALLSSPSVRHVRSSCSLGSAKLVVVETPLSHPPPPPPPPSPEKGFPGTGGGGGIRSRPAVRGKGTYGERRGQRMEEQGTWASCTQNHSEAGYGRPVDRGVWTAKTVKQPRQQPAHPQYANYWAPLMRKRHTMQHSAQPQHTNYWTPRTRKRHQQEHRPQRPTESSNPTQHAKGRTGDCPGPRKGATTRRKVTQGGQDRKIHRGIIPSPKMMIFTRGKTSDTIPWSMLRK